MDSAPHGHPSSLGTMRVELVITASQQLVRAVAVEEATLEESVAQLGVWEAAGVRVPSLIVRVRRADLLTASKLLTRGQAGVVAPRLNLAISERSSPASAMRSTCCAPAPPSILRSPMSAPPRAATSAISSTFPPT